MFLYPNYILKDLEFNLIIKEILKFAVTAGGREKVKELFAKVYERRMLLRLIGVKFTNLITGHYQINLFDDTIEQISLYQALDHIKKRYGVKSVRKALSMRQNLHDFSPFGKK